MSIKALIKPVVFSGAKYSGFNRLLRYSSRNKLLILCYHGVVDGDFREESHRFSSTVSVKEFRQQLRIINRYFNPVSAEDVYCWLYKGQSLPRSPVLITFDDGYRNNLQYAAPELIKAGMPALIAITTGYVGMSKILWPQELHERLLHWPRKTIPMPNGDRDHETPHDLNKRIELAEKIRMFCKQLDDGSKQAYLDCIREEPMPLLGPWASDLYGFLNWEEVRELYKKGFTIASHTVNHSILSRLSSSSLEKELLESKKTIEEEIGAPCRWIVYPNGGAEDVSQFVFSAAGKAGYKLGCKLTQKLNSQETNSFELDRVLVVGHIPEEVFLSRVSGLYTLFRQ